MLVHNISYQMIWTRRRMEGIYNIINDNVHNWILKSQCIESWNIVKWWINIDLICKEILLAQCHAYDTCHKEQQWYDAILWTIRNGWRSVLPQLLLLAQTCQHLFEKQKHRNNCLYSGYYDNLSCLLVYVFRHRAGTMTHIVADFTSSFTLPGTSWNLRTIKHLIPWRENDQTRPSASQSACTILSHDLLCPNMSLLDYDVDYNIFFSLSSSGCVYLSTACPRSLQFSP